ncbi:MAG: tRNA lysidine(34) synthetase TilS [Ruminococcus sp.]|nr:tRNA lysidine(34) synthetase TilS [Ruminococcus sp.]
MSDFSAKVLSTIKSFDMCNKSERLLICLSGGADSAALLLCLKELGFDICACHVNHQLRGAESDRDEQFCRQLCEKLDVRFESIKLDVTGYCKENGLSVELGARKLRYDYFYSFDVDKICTAHSLSDSLETTIFDLARGTGLKGLCGIPPVRDKIIRPLIECTREEIEAYLSSQGQDFVTDSTNLEDIYSRNKIRHNIIPVMKNINNGLYSSYSNTIGYLRADSDHLEAEADDLYDKCLLDKGYDCRLLSSSHVSIRRRAVMRIFDHEGIKCSSALIADTDSIIQNGGRLNISGDIFAVSSKGVLTFGYWTDPNEKPLAVTVDEMGKYVFENRNISFSIIEMPYDIANIQKKFTNCYMDYDKMNGVLLLRGRLPDDKIRLCNRDFNSDVRKLVNSAFRQEDRKSAVLIADGEGLIFVEKYGIADRVKVDASTKRVLVFEIS